MRTAREGHKRYQSKDTGAHAFPTYTDVVSSSQARESFGRSTKISGFLNIAAFEVTDAIDKFASVMQAGDWCIFRSNGPRSMIRLSDGGTFNGF